MWRFATLKQVISSRSPRVWQILHKAHIRPHIEHAGLAWAPGNKQDVEILERVQRRVTRHISGMRSLGYDERLKTLEWPSLEERRVRGDLILTYQTLRGNCEVDLKWHWDDPLSQQSGPASGIRSGNALRLKPPIYESKVRNNFLTARVAKPLRDLPAGIMNATSVNAFKNAYDACKLTPILK